MCLRVAQPAIKRRFVLGDAGDLVAERIHGPRSIAQVVVLVDFLVECLEALDRRIIRRVRVVEELHGTGHARFGRRFLIRLANGQSKHRERVFRQLQRGDQLGDVVENRT